MQVISQDSVGGLEVPLFELIHVAIYSWQVTLSRNCSDLLGLWLPMSLRRQDLGCHTDSLARVLRPCARASSASMGLCRRPTDQAQSHCEGITQRLVQNRQFYHTLPLQAGGTRKSRRRKVEPAEAGTGFVACL